MNFKRVLAISKKEIMHILRDPFTVAMAMIMPVILVSIFGFALDLDVKNISIGIDDRDQSFSSRKLISIFEQSQSFHIEKKSHWTDHEREIRNEKMKAILIIENGWEKKIKKDGYASVQFILDGSDNAVVGPAMSYLYGIQLRLMQEIWETKVQFPIRVVTRYLYNGELKSPYFIIPGLMSVVLALISILLTALTISKEWENGSMELLLSTPVSPLELILGKIIPYSFLGMIAVVIVYLVGRVFFDIPFRGSHFVFILSCFIFLTAYLAQGILISVVAKSQALAMQMAMVSGILPTMLLSGFIFSIASMPKFFQYLTMILPGRWFLQIARTLFLKESGFTDVWFPFMFLLLLNLILVTLSVLKFKRTLE